jgi:hypothetical protein
MSLQGVLSDFGAADIFQLIAQQRKTGILEISNGDRVLDVYFRDGHILRARPTESQPDAALAEFLIRTGAISEPDLVEAWRVQGDTLAPLPQVLLEQRYVKKEELDQLLRLISDESIFELFLWDQGKFNFKPQNVNEQDGDMMVGAEMVLLDALRMRDEWSPIRALLPTLECALAPSVDVEVYRERRAAIESSTGMSGEEVDRLFTRCDGRQSARRVIDLSRLGTFQGARGLSGLLKENVVHIEHKSARPEPVRHTLPTSNLFGKSTWILVPAALFAAGLFAIPAPQSDSFPLPSLQLSLAAAQGDLQELRAVLESYRWANGSYPASLALLRESGGNRLAWIDPAGYRYASQGGSYTLGLKAGPLGSEP